MWRGSACFLLLAAGALLAQHSYTPAEIEEGRRLYENGCDNCHGVTGDAINGIDFARGQFRRATSDEEMNRIIRNGIPGTGMPPGNFSEQQAASLVAYVRNINTPTGTRGTAGASTLPAGDAARGRAVFEGKGQCLTCHQVNGNGSRLGPDLSEAGVAGAPARGASGPVLPLSQQIELSLVDPNADVRPENRTFRAVTRGGQTITGRLLNQDTYSVQLYDSSNDRLVSLSKSNLRESGFVNSPMPSYRDKLTPQELADVISYLMTLKGAQ